MIDVQLDKVIHEQSRLKIMVLLASSKTQNVPFTQIKTELSFTAGNLSIQLKTLEEAGFITIEKKFEDNKPKTDVAITKVGKDALVNYMNELEKMLGGIK